ncbi:MAG: DUF4374 domain-containing protein [Prevotella sp.]|nr:DUF4374 domain-containing protein [Prevotella sp.]
MTKRTFHYMASWLMLCVAMIFTACNDETLADSEQPNAPYVMTLGITSGNTTTYYVVTTNDLMNGNINAIGKGIEQNGYRDYTQGGKTIFSIGGLGTKGVYGLQRGTDGLLMEKGEYVYNNSMDDLVEVDNQTMLSVELPARGTKNGFLTFRRIGIEQLDIQQSITTTPLAPLDSLAWPFITGVAKSGNRVYITYMPMNHQTFATEFTDTTYVAVYSYPDMTFQKLMKDTRFGPAGSWSAYNGLLKTENGDLYVMSNSSISNGYSQATKQAGFLKIPAGTTEFDAQYTYHFEQQTGGLKPAHIKYVGNGLVYAEVSTIVPQTAANRWGDKQLDSYIIDLYNQRATKINEIPTHDGSGGRRFVALVEGSYVYTTITTADGTYVYRINTATATAERGAKVSTTFVGGLFKLS